METSNNSPNWNTLCDAAPDYLEMGGGVPARTEAESVTDDAQFVTQEDRSAYKTALKAVGGPLSEGTIRLEVGYCDDLWPRLSGVAIAAAGVERIANRGESWVPEAVVSRGGERTRRRPGRATGSRRFGELGGRRLRT